MKKVIIRSGKVKPVVFRHPWVYAGSVSHGDANVGDGDLVDICDTKDNFLARGFYNSKSQIALRVVSWRKSEQIDREFFRVKIENALSLREKTLRVQERADCYRLVHSEADELPGLIVDRYGDYLVVQVTCLGMARYLDEITSILDAACKPVGIYERVDNRTNEAEGIQRYNRVIKGAEIPEEILVSENSLRFVVNLKHGQKTGFYSDQRDNRAAFTNYTPGKRVLDCFSYTGAFALYASKLGKAHSVLAVDSSAEAVELGRKNAELNRVTNVEFVQANAIQLLKDAADRNETFDVVVLDPPKLAPAKKDIDKALRKYVEVNRLAMRVLGRDGVLLSCSCSHHIDEEMFDRMLAEAALSTGKLVQILERRGQASDHPVKAGVNEGNYLKCRICRVTDS